jgi:hypothetical protein
MTNKHEFEALRKIKTVFLLITCFKLNENMRYRTCISKGFFINQNNFSIK